MQLFGIGEFGDAPARPPALELEPFPLGVSWGVVCDTRLRA